MRHFYGGSSKSEVKPSSRRGSVDGEKCSVGKKSKEHITVLVGANMSGSEKLAETISNCFRHAAFLANDVVDDGLTGIVEASDGFSRLGKVCKCLEASTSRYEYHYVEKNFDDPVTLRLTDGNDGAFYQERSKKQKPSRLTDFFKPAQ
uniref:Uncharacterized protein n=1 Tax=Ditylenchus dipsaci TaxID=166011 RepID=A0A915CSF0_9BILA